MRWRSAGGASGCEIGLLFTAVLFSSWGISLVELLRTGPDQLSWWGLVAAVLLRSQLQTGLFIIGHDAMHGVLWPEQPRRNQVLGALALGVYAALPYAICRRKHQRHHSDTATAHDPDFPADGRADLWSWYRQFMAGYLSWPQMGLLLGGWLLLGLLFQPVNTEAWISVLLFCTLPLLISSWQLFVFGTYLPHRAQRWPIQEAEPSSLELPSWLSLLACYHFSYHREHHQNPGLRWFELPSARRRSRPSTLQASLR